MSVSVSQLRHCVCIVLFLWDDTNICVRLGEVSGSKIALTETYNRGTSIWRTSVYSSVLNDTTTPGVFSASMLELNCTLHGYHFHPGK